MAPVWSHSRSPTCGALREGQSGRSLTWVRKSSAQWLNTRRASITASPRERLSAVAIPNATPLHTIAIASECDQG